MKVFFDTNVYVAEALLGEVMSKLRICLLGIVGILWISGLSFLFVAAPIFASEYLGIPFVNDDALVFFGIGIPCAFFNAIVIPFFNKSKQQRSRAILYWIVFSSVVDALFIGTQLIARMQNDLWVVQAIALGALLAVIAILLDVVFPLKVDSVHEKAA